MNIRFKMLASVLVTGALIGGSMLFSKVNAGSSYDECDKKVKICHNAGNNKYIEITVPLSAMNGHKNCGHEHGGNQDIMPAPKYGCPCSCSMNLIPHK